jgi:WD40 repeat protein
MNTVHIMLRRINAVTLLVSLFEKNSSLDNRTNNGVKELNESRAEYRNMSWTKDGKKLATASDALRIWNTDGDLITECPSEDNLWGVDWSPDGKFIITSSHNGHIRLWDNKGKLIRELKY